jgi:hypothetical protein
MNQQPIFTTTFHFKYHPDTTLQHLKELKKVLASMEGVTNVRCFKLNNMDYEFIWNYPVCSAEKYREHGAKGKAFLESLQGNATIPHNGMYGDIGVEAASAIIQDWNCDFFATEIPVPTANPYKTSTTDPIAFLKLQVNLHPEDAKAALQKWKEGDAKMGINDTRFFQISNTEYMEIATAPWKTYDQYMGVAGMAMEDCKSFEGKIEIKEMRVYGEFPKEMGNTWIEHWHPALIAPEVKL